MSTAKDGAMTEPLITVGMPVYNAGDRLRRAIDAMLAQTETNFELIISDNASTDEITRTITEEYARRDQRIRLTRQPFNQGIVENFLWVAREAKGKYFLWAAHDDLWSDNYLAALSGRLEEAPQAILATAATRVEQTAADSNIICKQFTVPAAPNGDMWQTLDLFLKENICVWMYGMFRTSWLQPAAPDLADYAVLSGGDRLWLFGLILDGPVVGDPAATFYYSDVIGKAKRDRTLRSRTRFLGLQIYHLTRLTWTRVPARDRTRCLWKVAGYLYQHQVSRRNPLGTSLRIMKLTALGTWFGLEAGMQQVLKPVQRRKAA